VPLDVTEYSNLASSGRGAVVMAGQEPAVANQQVAIGVASAQSSPFADTTRFVRVHTDVACRIAFGSNPTAAASSMRMPAGGTEFFGVSPNLRVAVISTT
jgi:hypothetical protein